MELKKEISYKNKLYRISIKSPIQINIEKYKDWKRRVSKRISQERRYYYNLQLAERQKETKSYWKIIKEITGNPVTAHYPDYFVSEEQPINDPLIIANKFNDFFINIGDGPERETKIQGSSISHTHYLDEPNKYPMFAEPVTEEELTNVFKFLKNSAAGYDGFNRTIISQIFQIILRSLVHIINLSLLSGVVPKEIKTAKVKPLFKGENPHLFNNYFDITTFV